MNRFLITDLDETKISIKEFYLNALVQTAHSLGHTHVTLDDVKCHYIEFVEGLGLSFKTFWTRFADFDPRENQEGATELAKQGKIRKFPDCDYFIEQVKALGFKIGVLSDNPHAMREMIALGMDKVYDAYQVWKKVMGPEFLKPHPGLALKLLKDLGYKEGDIWMMGDTELDIELGRVLSKQLKVPIKTIQHHTVGPRSESANFVVTSLTEAVKIIKDFYSQ